MLVLWFGTFHPHKKQFNSFKFFHRSYAIVKNSFRIKSVQKSFQMLWARTCFVCLKSLSPHSYLKWLLHTLYSKRVWWSRMSEKRIWVSWIVFRWMKKYRTIGLASYDSNTRNKMSSMLNESSIIQKVFLYERVKWNKVHVIRNL